MSRRPDRITTHGHPECGHRLRVLVCSDQLPRIGDTEPATGLALDPSSPESVALAHGLGWVWSEVWKLPFDPAQQWVCRVMSEGWISHPMLTEFTEDGTDRIFGKGGFFGVANSHPATWTWITYDDAEPDLVLAVTTLRVRDMWRQLDPLDVGSWETTRRT